MSNYLTKKKIFNTSSTEKFMECKVLGGNPNGIINFNRTPHKFFHTLYKNMLARTWFPEQVNISKDKTNYSKLTPAEKRAYDLVLAQLIANDSIQTNQLMDSLNSYITSPVINACIAQQAAVEALHSESYAVMAEDICQDTDRIYEMHLYDEELMLKNKSVEEMYTNLHQPMVPNKDGSYTYFPPSKEDILLAMVANQILEELVFPGGFAVMLTLGSKMVGSAEMIVEIMKDETLSHVPLFYSMFRCAVDEEYDGAIPNIVIRKAHELITNMVYAEKRWTNYVSKGILGFSRKVVDIFVENKADSVCKNLRLPTIYNRTEHDLLGKLLSERLRGGTYESRSNFFEVNATEYSKGSIVDDY